MRTVNEGNFGIYMCRMLSTQDCKFYTSIKFSLRYSNSRIKNKVIINYAFEDYFLQFFMGLTRTPQAPHLCSDLEDIPYSVHHMI